MTGRGIIAAAGLTASGFAFASLATIASAEEAPQQEKKICRTYKMTGSLTRRQRVCLTEAQWRELNSRTQRGLQELQGSASGSPACISAQDVAGGAPSAAGPPGAPGL
jgi:hypothetical protein